MSFSFHCFFFSSLAAKFPFIASAFLFGIYLVIRLVSQEYITFVLNIYFSLIGIVALFRAIQPLIHRIPLALVQQYQQRQFHLKLTENEFIYIDYKFDFVDIGGLIFSILVGVWYLLKRHWIANNFFGIAFSINAIEILHFNKFVISSKKYKFKSFYLESLMVVFSWEVCSSMTSFGYSEPTVS